MDLPLTLRTAVTLAHELEEIFLPACERFEIAGSVRRHYAEHTRDPEAARVLKDIELVVIPKLVEDPHALFAQTTAVELLMRDGKKSGVITDDPDHKCDGEKYKRFIFRRHCKVDLFIVTPPASWGATLAIRTGDKDFSRLLVSSRASGGAMPAQLRLKHGGLCQAALHEGSDTDLCTSTCRIETDSEQAFFAALDLPFVPVDRRTEKDFHSIISSRRKLSNVSPVAQT